MYLIDKCHKLGIIDKRKNMTELKDLKIFIIDNSNYMASSFIIETDLPHLSLIHTPTMRYPSRIKDDMIVYYCMRSTLICALKNDIKCIVIPVFGGSCGGISGEVAGKRMREAYDQILGKVGPNYDI